MDSSTLFVIGAALVLVGFVLLVRSRFSAVRRRLGSASSIRSRARMGGSAMTTYQTGESSSVQLVSIILMVAGGIAVIFSML